MDRALGFSPVPSKKFLGPRDPNTHTLNNLPLSNEIFSKASLSFSNDVQAGLFDFGFAT